MGKMKIIKKDNKYFDFQFIPGFRKSSKLLLLTKQQQLFKVKSAYHNVKRYICYTDSCRVSVNLTNEEVCTPASLERNHNHAAPKALIKRLTLINNVKSQCEEWTLKKKGVREIFEEECKKNRIAASTLDFSKFRRQLFKIRSEGMPKNPTTPSEIKLLFENKEFVEEFGLSKHNAQPLYRETIVENNFAYTIFLSPSILDLIEKSSEERNFSIDGTFNTVSLCGYKQLVIVHLNVLNNTLPFIYVLVTHKSTEAYEHLFAFINSNLFKFNAASFTCDYEASLRKALKTVFPTTMLYGCWFHYCQALKRQSSKINTFGAMLANHVDCYKWFRTFLCLPLAQPRQMEEMLTNLKANMLTLPKANYFLLQQFMHYFEKEWMLKITPYGFSVHDQNITTTSSLELFNASFANKLEKQDSLFKFIEVIRDDDFESSNTLSNAAEEKCRKPSMKEIQIQELIKYLDEDKISLEEFFNCLTNKEDELFKWDDRFEDWETGSDIGEEDDEDDFRFSQMTVVLMCIVCMKKPRDIVLQPCTHFKICAECLQNLVKSAQRYNSLLLCPYCRQKVQDHSKIIQ